MTGLVLHLIGFSLHLTTYWLRGWLEFSGPITEQSDVKPTQTCYKRVIIFHRGHKDKLIVCLKMYSH